MTIFAVGSLFRAKPTSRRKIYFPMQHLYNLHCQHDKHKTVQIRE